ncbi:unnamed protein product [Trichobilharzia regenti]|nr:unnamed protein product [Trichobilharzia regenti]
MIRYQPNSPNEFKRPSVQQCLNHPWMAMREEDRPPVKRTVSLFRHSTRRKPKGVSLSTVYYMAYCVKLYAVVCLK